MSQELLRTAKEILAWLAAAGIIIDLTPGIKIQPVRYIIKRIGALMNHDIKEQLDKIEKDLQQHKIESWRHEILTFANECMNRRKHTKEEFDNFFETHSDYEEYIKANKLENGRVDMAHKYVSNVYMRRCEKNDFLVEREEDEE